MVQTKVRSMEKEIKIKSGKITSRTFLINNPQMKINMFRNEEDVDKEFQLLINSAIRLSNNIEHFAIYTPDLKLINDENREIVSKVQDRCDIAYAILEDVFGDLLELVIRTDHQRIGIEKRKRAEDDDD